MNAGSSVVRPRLIEAAIQLYGLYGFNGVNMRQLAKAAHTTTGTLYRLFGHDRKLYAAAVKMAISRVLEAVVKSVFLLADNPDNNDALALVGQALELWYNSLGQAETRLLMHIEFSDASHRKLAWTPLHKMTNHVARSLQSALPGTTLEVFTIAQSWIAALVQLKISEHSDARQAARVVGQYVLLLRAK